MANYLTNPREFYEKRIKENPEIDRIRKVKEMSWGELYFWKIAHS